MLIKNFIVIQDNQQEDIFDVHTNCWDLLHLQDNFVFSPKNSEKFHFSIDVINLAQIA